MADLAYLWGEKVVPRIVFGLCAYEVGGLLGFWPTVSTRCRKLPEWARIAVAAGMGFGLSYHLANTEGGRDGPDDPASA